MRVRCSKGTYIRTLGEDIGERLGCGAHLSALRRTGVGALTLDAAICLSALEQAQPSERDAWLQPVDVLLSTFAAVRLDPELTRRFLQGQRIRLPQPLVPAPLLASDGGDGGDPGGQRVRVYEGEGRLLGTARFLEGLLAPERVIAAQAA